METSRNRVEILAAVNFVESHFSDGQGHKTHSWRMSNAANSHSHSHSHPHPPPQDLPPGVPADQYFSGLPNYPPPGLVRASPTTLAPVHLITNEDASLFSDFAGYLDNGVDEDGNPVVVDLTCSICMESKLLVSNCQAANSSSDSRPSEDLCVMPCGHFIGYDCLYEWLLTTANSTPTCPLCRFELVYRCGHDVEPREYTSLMTRREQVPLTVPEGGMVPNYCDACYERCIMQAVERLRHLLFPDDILDGDLQYENSAEILRSTSVQFRRRVLNYLYMNEHYVRW
ncbi:hypothetical protein F4680DRAFT_451481 [Xylaria scruposa]|nr:hypothetical protein F4680DRAFT_451481 [Xylaria scruposa]